MSGNKNENTGVEIGDIEASGAVHNRKSFLGSMFITDEDFVVDIGINRWEKIDILFFRGVAAEFLASLLFLYITVSEIEFRNIAGLNLDQVMDPAWTFGISILLLVYVFAGISGANINPAVTFGLMVTKRVSAVRAVCYIVAQCVGATVGCAIAYAIRSDVSQARPWNFVQHNVEPR